MKRVLVTVGLFACRAPAAPAQPIGACAAPLPLLAKQHSPNDSKLYIAALDGLAIGAPKLVTGKRGYVNQPAFSDDGGGLYFTWRPEAGQADIYLHDLRTNTERAITCTSQEEYVASPTPDKHLSVIRVEPDLARRLVVLDAAGAPSRTLFPELTTIGAYRWADAHTVAIMASKPDGSASTLVLGDVQTGALTTVAEQIGGALALIPSSRALSYVDMAGDQPALMRLDLATHATTKLVEMPDGIDTVAWLADGSALAGSGNRIIRWAPAASGWQDVAKLALDGPITRVVVSPDQRTIAIVVKDQRSASASN